MTDQRIGGPYVCNLCGEHCDVADIHVCSPGWGSVTHSPTGTEAAICQDLASRQALGIKKYGQTVAENPLTLRQWLQHAYEECLDQAVYLKRAIEQIDKENSL